MSDQKIEHRAIECFGLLNITQVPRTFNDREESAQDAARQLARHGGWGERVLFSDHDVGWRDDLFEVEFSRIVHRSSPRWFSDRTACAAPTGWQPTAQMRPPGDSCPAATARLRARCREVPCLPAE